MARTDADRGRDKGGMGKGEEVLRPPLAGVLDKIDGGIADVDDVQFEWRRATQRRPHPLPRKQARKRLPSSKDTFQRLPGWS